MRLCRFSISFCDRRIKLSDAVPHDADAPDFVAAYALAPVDIDLFHELTDNLGGNITADPLSLSDEDYLTIFWNAYK